MREYILFVKGIWNKVLITIILCIFWSILFVFSNKKEDIFLSVFFTSLFISLILVSNMSLFFYHQPGNSSFGSVSPLNLLFVLPVKRKTIAVWEFLSDFITCVFYVLAYNIAIIIINTFVVHWQQYNIFLLLISPLATNLLLLAFFAIAMGCICFINNKILTSALTTMAILFWFVPVMAIFYVVSSTSGKKVETFLENLYTNSIYSIIYLLISVGLFIIAFIVNALSIYRREV